MAATVVDFSEYVGRDVRLVEPNKLELRAHIASGNLSKTHFVFSTPWVAQKAKAVFHRFPTPRVFSLVLADCKVTRDGEGLITKIVGPLYTVEILPRGQELTW